MKKSKSPFKDKKLIIKEISKFLNKYQSTVATQSSRIGDYFEMSAYNSIVKFYENNGFDINIKNLIDGYFKYKLSPTGYPHNFSYFEIAKIYNYRNKKIKRYIFEIHHNVAIESGIENGLFVTPDICVINKDSISELKNSKYFFSGSRSYYYVKNKELQTFCEVKNLNPFPELLFNFIGLLNELKLDVFQNSISSKRPKHIAPSLMLSGGGNFHTRKIKDSLMNRYYINVFFGLFFKKSQPYSISNMGNVNKIGTAKNT